MLGGIKFYRKKIMGLILFSKNHDTFNNPSIDALIQICIQNDISISFIIGGIHFKNQYKEIKVILEPNNYRFYNKNFFNLKNLIKAILNFFNCLIFYFKLSRLFLHQKKGTIIGIDPGGIVWANNIYKMLWIFKRKFEIHYWSFELFFIDEGAEKMDEILACKNIKQLIIQDEVRGKLLIKENNISPDVKITYLPVAPIERRVENLTNLDLLPNLKEILKFKSLIFFGSFKPWAGSNILLEALEKGLPKDWSAVIHSRFPISMEIKSQINRLISNGQKIYIDETYIKNFDDAIKYLKQFNCGLCLYIPDYKSIYTGKNIEHIGLSSGKFSMFINAGVNLICSKQEPFNEIIRKNKIGLCIDNSSDNLIQALNNIKLNNNIINIKSIYNIEEKFIKYLINCNELKS
jgi:hypothetical protein